MAAFEQTRTAPFGATTTLKIIRFFETIWDGLSNWNDARMTRNALARLSDRELDDIGLCRGDIDTIGAVRHL